MKTADQIREEVSSRIVALVAESKLPWRCPWSGVPNTGAARSVRGRFYTGTNQLTLGRSPFKSSVWGTATAWAEVRQVVAENERPTYVTVVKMVKARRPSPLTGVHSMFSFMRELAVYNAEQLAASPKAVRWLAVGAAAEPDFEPAEALVRAAGVTVTHGGRRAYYARWPGDFIRMPEKDCFETKADYYETLFHEVVHWTEDDRRVGQAKGHNHAFGELVAEIGACFLMAQLNVPSADQLLDNSAGYIGEWLGQMRGDPKYIFQACSQASKAVNYVLSLLPAKTKKCKKAEKTRCPRIAGRVPQ